MKENQGGNITEPQAAILSPSLQNTKFKKCFGEEEQETTGGGCGMPIRVPGLLSASIAASGMCVITREECTATRLLAV